MSLHIKIWFNIIDYEHHTYLMGHVYRVAKYSYTHVSSYYIYIYYLLLPSITHQRMASLPCIFLDKTNPAFSIHVFRSCGFCHVHAETIGESDGGSTRRRWERRATKEESCGTDFTNKCRRLNPGMLQDGSLSLNHRLPAASYLPPRLAACCSLVPSWHTSSFSPLRLSCRFSRHFVLRGGASTLANDSLPVLGNLPHAVAIRNCDRLSFSCLRLVLSLNPNLTAGRIDGNYKNIAKSIDTWQTSVSELNEVELIL